MKKKIIAALLVMVMLFSFTACGPVSSAELKDMSMLYLTALSEGDSNAVNLLSHQSHLTSSEHMQLYLQKLSEDGIVLEAPFELKSYSMSSAAYNSNYGGSYTETSYTLTSGENKYDLTVTYLKNKLGEGIVQFRIGKEK